MKTSDILHILRNPFGISDEKKRTARIEAANMIEDWQKWSKEVLKWAEDNGLDITAYQPTKTRWEINHK